MNVQYIYEDYKRSSLVGRRQPSLHLSGLKENEYWQLPLNSRGCSIPTLELWQLRCNPLLLCSHLFFELSIKFIATLLERERWNELGVPALDIFTYQNIQGPST
ncbi:unnamed protein product [Pleuronectes platessa]|uniref:Uncharacterized protein n=1 Tax=Pleuronectes platessa TaxID=8262 RepID=A0A9N7TWI2_PLEPL|nr:unnamed protein product [Pleuronectes platessa]